MLLAPALERLMVCADHHQLQSDVAQQLPERIHDGICLLLPRGPPSALALSHDSAPKRHGNMLPVVPDLLKDCPNGIVRGVRAQHKSFVRVHQEQPQLPQAALFQAVRHILGLGGPG